MKLRSIFRRRRPVPLVMVAIAAIANTAPTHQEEDA